VVQNRYPLRINVGFLLNAPIGSSRDIHFELDHLTLTTDLEVSSLIGLTRVSRTAQGILFVCSFKGVVNSQCVRCLIDFQLPLETDFSEVFALKGGGATESGLRVPDDANIDLTELVSEYLTIEIPIKNLCRLDCKGLCPECGEDLNFNTCEHQQAQNHAHGGLINQM
jgi:uncharacterized protein